ncbi:phospholipid carrier-dependent glycosyltransferase [Fontivita pretiosa]|uniref:phospholipid carrier-dependent glycosyltransferase n=1 Tax=Fontivita pretiosa TaxID=2989684 RepID=UPI003D166CEF
MTTDHPGSGERPRRNVALAAIGGITALLLLFAVLSYSAVLGKSPTYDETLHSVAGYVHRIRGDFRINPEDPALFGYWGSLVHGRNALTISTDLRYWDQMIEDFATFQWYYSVHVLYGWRGNNGDAFIQKSRFMFVPVGMGLGGLIGWWAWRIAQQRHGAAYAGAGAAAGFLATALLALDPNFLAHSALVKNDVMLSLLMASLAAALWRFGQRASWPSLLAMCLCCAAAVNVKFSGILCGPIIFAAVLIRALLPLAWPVRGLGSRITMLSTRRQRLAVVPVVCVLAAIATYVMIWACYGFRFSPTANPDVLLNTPRLVQRAKLNTIIARTRGSVPVTSEMVQAEPEPTMVRAIVWAESKRLLPQAWLHGFLYTYATTKIRSSYLLGQTRIVGFWYYFPCAMLFKTPTASLLAIPTVITAVLLSSATRRRKAMDNPAAAQAPPRDPDDARFRFGSADWWSPTCLGLPAAVYAASAMSSNLNLGLRHILPVYPFIFVGLAVGMAGVLRQWRRTGWTLMGLIVFGLAIESLASYPNFIPFFNAPSGGMRNGIRLLGDSNLDWGQDLPLLGRWQAEHRDRPLYLAYFGTADPRAYGVTAYHLPMEAGGWPFASSRHMPDPNSSSYLAVSATNLQGIYVQDPAIREFYRDLLENRQPLAILGGSIYVYPLPLKR